MREVVTKYDKMIEDMKVKREEELKELYELRGEVKCLRNTYTDQQKNNNCLMDLISKVGEKR